MEILFSSLLNPLILSMQDYFAIIHFKNLGLLNNLLYLNFFSQLFLDSIEFRLLVIHN